MMLEIFRGSFVTQSGDNWCWAGCIRIALNWGNVEGLELHEIVELYRDKIASCYPEKDCDVSKSQCDKPCRADRLQRLLEAEEIGFTNVRTVPRTASWSTVTQLLDEGNFVMAQLYIGGVTRHLVLMVGVVNSMIAVVDPMCGYCFVEKSFWERRGGICGGTGVGGWSFKPIEAEPPGGESGGQDLSIGSGADVDEKILEAAKVPVEDIEMIPVVRVRSRVNDVSVSRLSEDRRRCLCRFRSGDGSTIAIEGSFTMTKEELGTEVDLEKFLCDSPGLAFPVYGEEVAAAIEAMGLDFDRTIVDFPEHFVSVLYFSDPSIEARNLLVLRAPESWSGRGFAKGTYVSETELFAEIEASDSIVGVFQAGESHSEC